MHTNVQSSSTYNIQDMEATQVPMNRLMDKENAYIYIYIYIYTHTHTHTIERDSQIEKTNLWLLK